MTRQSSDMVYRVARAANPHLWGCIDRERAKARCYRDTPFAEAGFESPESAEEFARVCESIANSWEIGGRAVGRRILETVHYAELVGALSDIVCYFDTPEPLEPELLRLIDVANNLLAKIGAQS